VEINGIVISKGSQKLQRSLTKRFERLNPAAAARTDTLATIRG
jgi:hypothetical protein